MHYSKILRRKFGVQKIQYSALSLKIRILTLLLFLQPRELLFLNGGGFIGTFDKDFLVQFRLGWILYSDRKRFRK